MMIRKDSKIKFRYTTSQDIFISIASTLFKQRSVETIVFSQFISFFIIKFYIHGDTSYYIFYIF